MARTRKANHSDPKPKTTEPMVETTETEQPKSNEPEIKYIAATGLEDYGRWKSMFHDRKGNPKKSFRRGRIWA